MRVVAPSEENKEEGADFELTIDNSLLQLDSARNGVDAFLQSEDGANKVDELV